MSITKKKVKKSSSSRLRSVFYRLWEEDDKGFDLFEDYYESKMDKVIEHYKKLLE